MNKLLIGAVSVLASVSLFSIPTAPVSAATAADDGAALMVKLTDLDQRISKAQESGLLSKGDAANYGKQIDQLEKLHAQFGIDGFTKIETRSLSQKISVLKADLARDTNNRI